MRRKKRNNLRKELFLDRETSHGGWPNGNNSDWLGRKPVNNIIYQYLEDMGLADDVPHARLSESKVRSLIRKSLREAIAAGSTPGEAIVKNNPSDNESSTFNYEFNDLIAGLIFDEAVSFVGSKPKLKEFFNSVDEDLEADSDRALQTLIQAMSLLSPFVLNNLKNLLTKHKQRINQKFYEFTLMDFDLASLISELKKSLFKNIAFIPDYSRYHVTHFDSIIGKGFSNYLNGWESVLLQHILQNVKEATKGMMSTIDRRVGSERRSRSSARKDSAMMGSPGIQMVKQNQKFANPRPELDKIFFFVGQVDLEVVDATFELDSYDHSDERYNIDEYLSEFQDATLQLYSAPGVTPLYAYYDTDYEIMCCLCMVGLELGSSSKIQIFKYIKSYANAKYGKPAGNYIDLYRETTISNVSKYKTFRDVLLELPPEAVENYVSETIYDLNLTEPKEEFVTSLIQSNEFADRVQGDMLMQGLQDSNKGLAASVYKMIGFKSFDEVKTPNGNEYNFNLEKYKKAVFEFVMDIEDMITDHLNSVAEAYTTTQEVLDQLGNIYND